jgi:hypothetical protein
MDQGAKRTTLIILWCFATAILIAGAVWWGVKFSKTASYHNSQYGFSVQYPRQWQKMEHYQGTAVAFIRPKQTALDIFQPNVNITIQEVPDQIATLSSFSSTITKQMNVVFKKNISIKEDKDVEFAKRKGHILIVDAPNPSHLKMLFVWTMKGDFAYLLTFMAQTTQYQELLPTINAMIKSFELK